MVSSEHGSSFADLFAGVEVAAGLTGHGLSLADAATLAIAIDVAQAHGGPAELHGHETGYWHDVPALAGSGWAAPEPAYVQPRGRLVTLPGVARDATSVEVLVWPHGDCGNSVRGHVQQLAQRAGLAPFRFYEHNVTGLHDIETMKQGILPLGPEERSDARRGLPSGWYRDARGTTYLWRECFRRRPGLFQRDDFERRRTFLVVTGTTWAYRETGDYETRAAFSVFSSPLVLNRRWTYRYEQIKEYRGLAERLATGLKGVLAKYPASSESIERRRRMSPDATVPAGSSA